MVMSLRYPTLLLWLCILGWWLPGLAVAAKITVSIDPDPPQPGESFRLAFSATGDVNAEPNFKPLENRFEILGRNQQTSLRAINGRYTRTSSWILEVLAREEGPIRVPAIAFGADHSPPLTRALGRAADPSTQDEGLFLEVDLAPRNPYVQQQVICTVRVWRRYELSNASLSEPRLDSDAVIRPLGKDRQFQDQRNGLRYDVIERRYAIFPQASGKATLAPVTVTAQVMERASSLFELFGRAVRTRRISAPAVPLEVRPVPAEFPAGATWLPAPRVRLNELWAPDDATARVGEPVSRTVSLWVSGQTSGQLPELLPAAVPDLKVYADQPQMKDDTRDDAINAVRQEKAALVAEAAGTFEIPAVTLPWWNTATDTLEFARLPSRPLQILAAPGTPEPSTAALPAPAPAAAATPVAGRRQQVAAAPADWLRWRGWFPVACVALLGWAMTVVVLRRRNAPVTPAGDATSPAPVALAQARDAVLKAARTGVANDTAAALLDWARLVWPDSPPLSLGELARRLPAPLAREIANLEATRHARTPTAWRGEALREALSVAPISAAVATSQAGRLPDIFRLAR